MTMFAAERRINELYLQSREQVLGKSGQIFVDHWTLLAREQRLSNTVDTVGSRSSVHSKLLSAASDATVDFRQFLLAIPATEKYVSKSDNKTDLRNLLVQHIEQVLNFFFPVAVISMADEISKREVAQPIVQAA